MDGKTADGRTYEGNIGSEFVPVHGRNVYWFRCPVSGHRTGYSIMRGMAEDAEKWHFCKSQ